MEDSDEYDDGDMLKIAQNIGEQREEMLGYVQDTQLDEKLTAAIDDIIQP